MILKHKNSKEISPQKTHRNHRNMRHSSVIYTVWKVYNYGVFSGPYFPVFGLNTEVYTSVLIQEYGPEKVPYLDTFHAVIKVKIKILIDLEQLVFLFAWSSTSFDIGKSCLCIMSADRVFSQGIYRHIFFWARL